MKLYLVLAATLSFMGCKKNQPIPPLEEAKDAPFEIKKIEVTQGNDQAGYWNQPLDTILVRLTLNHTKGEIPLSYFYKDPESNQSFYIVNSEKTGNDLILKVLWNPTKEVRSNTLKVYFTVSCASTLLQQGICDKKDSIILNSSFRKRWESRYQGNQGGYNVLQDLHFTDELNGLVIGEGSGLLKTNDGGQNWTRHSPPRSDNSAYILSFTGRDTALVNLVNNYSYFTYDGGNSFSQVDWTPPFVGHRSSSSYYLKSRDVIHTVGWNGQIAKSVNGGKSWDKSGSFPVLNALYHITGVGKDTLFTCGSVGFLARSIDAGKNWTRIELPLNQNLHTLYFINSDNGFAAGQGGVILRTENGGNTWTRVDTKLKFPIIAMRFFDVNNGLVVTSAGEISETTNGGINWTTKVKDNYGVYELKKVNIKNRHTIFGVQQASIFTYDLSAN